MKKFDEVLKCCYKNGLITAKEYNNLCVYVIYRVVFETKQHYIIRVVFDEDSARNICDTTNGTDSEKEYFFQKIWLT